MLNSLKKKLFFLQFLWGKYLEQKFKMKISSRFGCTIDAEARIAIDNIEDIKIGRGVYIGAFTLVRVGDEPSSAGLCCSGLEIGEETYIGELNNIRAGGGTIRIGRKCQISQQVSIIASNHSVKKGVYIKDQPSSPEKTSVEIGDDVWIGCGAQILPGVRIGDGAVIGAGSLVNKDVPEGAIVGGNPARILSFRE